MRQEPGHPSRQPNGRGRGVPVLQPALEKNNKNLLISQIFFLFYKKYLCAEPPHDGRVLQVHPLEDMAEEAGEAEELVGQSGVSKIKLPKGYICLHQQQVATPPKG